MNARPHFDLWSSIPARIPAAGLGFPKLPSTNWMVWQPKGVWISVSHLKALATLLGCPQADLTGSQSFPVSFNIIVLALCVGFLFVVVCWSKQQLLILFLSSGASCFQCCSCSCSSYCAIISCNCSQLLEVSIGTAAAFVTVAMGTFAATVAGGVLLASCFFPRISESVLPTGNSLAAHILHLRWTGSAYGHRRRTAGITPLNNSWSLFQHKVNVAILSREQQQQSPSSLSKQEIFSVMIEESGDTQWQPHSFKIHKSLKNLYASSPTPSSLDRNSLR